MKQANVQELEQVDPYRRTRFTRRREWWRFQVKQKLGEDFWRYPGTTPAKELGPACKHCNVRDCGFKDGVQLTWRSRILGRPQQKNDQSLDLYFS
jgi:hypothetical protein